MTVIGEVRRENLKRLIEEKYDGVVQRLAKECNIQHSQLWRVLKEEQVAGQPRYVGEKLARKIEQAAGLYTGWLDTTPDKQSVSEANALADRIRGLSPEDRAVVLRMVEALVPESE